MNAKILAAFLAGALLPALLLWNPARWAWADRLAGREPAAHDHTASSTRPPDQLWTCGMHPQVLESEPGLCPICKMQLVPVEAPSNAGQHDSHSTGEQPATGVRVNPGFLQSFAVKTAVVDRGSVPIEVQTVGVLEHNQENVVSVNTKFAGWIEKAHINTRGETVERGDLLFEIYSPELVASQKEYLAALEYAELLRAQGASPAAVSGAEALASAAHERLRSFDVSLSRIDALQQTRQVRRTVAVHAPASGLIVSKLGQSLEGMRLTPGMTVLEIGSHAKLWVKAQIYESDLRHVGEGSFARIEIDAFPGRAWGGRVAFFDPAVDPSTRTLTALIEVENPDAKLAPNMFANVTFRSGGGAGAVVVPDQAVIHSGERAVVVVRKGESLFEPREVRLGNAGRGKQEILAGLEPGEEIVISSQFLIDSESNLRAAIGQLLHQH